MHGGRCQQTCGTNAERDAETERGKATQDAQHGQRKIPATLTSCFARENLFFQVTLSPVTVILQLIAPTVRTGGDLAGWVAANGGNIRHADHHTDSEPDSS